MNAGRDHIATGDSGRSHRVGDEGTQTLTVKCTVAVVYFKQGHLELAHGLQSQILDARVITLGSDHESTWYTMAIQRSFKWLMDHSAKLKNWSSRSSN